MNTKNELKNKGSAFWDSNPCGGEWGSYRNFMHWIQQTEPYIFQILDKYEWNNKRVVEVGCGQGVTLNYLPPRGAFMYGVDMSFNSLLHSQGGAAELGHPGFVRFIQSDAENVAFADNAFDMAVSCGVLHHTSDTARGIQEVYRVLKPGGYAIIMLYRKGNPKWWMTKLLRMISGLLDKIYGRSNVIADRLRRKIPPESQQGTALLELFGVPVLKAFTNKESLKMFSEFSEVRISNHQPGFYRLADIIACLRPFKRILAKIDKWTRQTWGFYQVIEARK